MKNRPQTNCRRRRVAVTPAVVLDSFIIGLVAWLFVFGKLGIWLLNAAKALLGR